MRTKLEVLRTALDEAELHRTGDDYPGQTDEYRRQLIVETAVAAADELIMEGSDGSVEETDYLTSAVAQAFVAKVHGAMQSKLLRAELAKRAKR